MTGEGCRLIAQASTSSAESFTREIGSLIPGLRRYAMFLTRDSCAADDLVQDTLIRSIEKLHLWQEGTDLRAWLFAILHNLHIDELRRASRGRVIEELNEDDPRFGQSPPQAEWLRLHDVQRALTKLPVDQRSVLLLVGLAEEPYETAASLLDLPVGTVRSRLWRGRDLLRRLTGDFGGRRTRPRRVTTGRPLDSSQRDPRQQWSRCLRT